jgi:hypothetical protein
MLTGATISLLWAVYIALGAAGGIAFVLGMRSGV